MSRLRVTIPTKHLRQSTAGLILSPGIRAWLRRWAPDTEVHLADDVYELEFHRMFDLAQFKLNFGIDSNKHDGGFDMKYTKVSRFKYDEIRDLLLEAMVCEPDMRYEINSQPWQIGCVPIRFQDPKFDQLAVYFDKLVQPLIHILRSDSDFAWTLPSIVQYVDELRQCYLPVPVVMITRNEEEIDISNMDLALIALMQ